MAPQISSLQKLFNYRWSLAFGLPLGLIICFWSNAPTKSQSVFISQRDIDENFLEARSISLSNRTLLPRDDYSCSASKPCSNGACCGESGFCGYGPTYCGSGCLANCDAIAECGQYAKFPDTQCPLNTCCSQFGFCGTTSDFCATGCQSNCVLHPTPPSSGSTGDIIQSKVIGYYESWNAAKTCHKVTPTNLPLDALTHVNFAFASIDPTSLQVVPMDSSTPSSLFQDVGNLKSLKQDLSIFISVGGWSFSDNGTATQPLFGEIASDASKRQAFANNVVQFLRQYGFDGVDIDWEYPGAPDRGGQAQDTANYVSLLQTLRQTFDASGGKYSISFTAPLSYWYLRWFDLPSMIKYADWINLMTYDLHGVWDASDPIGNIVQGHTNLTEIKLATELFWRVNIPPAKIVMGFGFYGRSFTLADPKCTTPGCLFKGASKPGPCSATSGILAYYEIMAIIQGTSATKRGTITPTHDKVDAVNYFVFDDDQWVSYDDAVTFKQKVDWANNIGLGGAMIWASDLDDDKYSAHYGLLGRTIESTATLQSVDKALSNPQSVIEDLSGSNGQNCFAYTGKCVNLDDSTAMQNACGSGFTVVGWDDAGCGKKKCHCGKPICCPNNAAPSNCQWRGNNNQDAGSRYDCSAQCAPGEVNIGGFASSWGGGFSNDGNTDKCGRGKKVFCCTNPDFPQVTAGCSYAPCRSSCSSGYTSVFSKTDNCFVGSQQYCCPDPVSLTDCHWAGGSGRTECTNAVCSATELEIDRAHFGGSSLGGCAWGRQKAACCTVQKAPGQPASCSANLCTALPGYCNNDDNDESAIDYEKRDHAFVANASSEFSQHLNRRGNAEVYLVPGLAGVRILTAAFPSIGELFGGPQAAQVLRRFFRLISGFCVGPSVNVGTIADGADPPNLNGLQAEHPIDRQIMKYMPLASVSGVLKSGASANLPPLPHSFWMKDSWLASNAKLAARPPVGGPNGDQPESPNDRVLEAFGSHNYRFPFMAVDAQINGPKGRVMALRVPTSIGTIQGLAELVVTHDDEQHADRLLQSVRAGFAVFEYLNTPQAVARWNAVRQQVRLQFSYIEEDLNVPNLVAWWDLFSADYFNLVGERARRWAPLAIRAAAVPLVQAQENGRILRHYRPIMDALDAMLEPRNIAAMETPPDTSSQLPNFPPNDDGGVKI